MGNLSRCFRPNEFIQIGIDAFNLAINYFNTTLSIDEEEFRNTEIKLFPNPVINELNIKTNNSSVSKIEIYALNGARLMSQSISDNKNVRLSNLHAGIYFVSFLDNDNTVIGTKKIIKQ